MILFIAGTVIAVIGQQKKERIRNVGWVLKNQMLNKGYYSMSMKDVNQLSGIQTDDIIKVSRQYPNEFSIVNNSNGSQSRQTLVLSDSLHKARLFERSEKILAAYLNNDSVLTDGSIKSFDSLFVQNDLFTYDIIYKLIADSGSRFSLNLVDVHDKTKGFGVVKLKR